MDRLKALTVFNEVVGSGSFTNAANRLGMSRLMVSRHIDELERWLGVQLFHRSTRRMSLTSAGQQCLESVADIVGQAEKLIDMTNTRNQKPSGLLRVTSSIAFGIVKLAPAIAAYLKRYPEVSIDLQVLDRRVNLIEERIDLAIRISQALDPELIARRIASCPSVVCASKEYLDRYGVPKTPEELKNHNCLSYHTFGDAAWHFKKRGKAISVTIEGNFKANEIAVLMEVALSGGGISLQPQFLVEHKIKEGALIPILEDWSLPEMYVWGVFLSRRNHSAALKSLLDFLATYFGDKPL